MPFSTYMQSEIGHAEIEPGHPLEAGSHAELVITYTAGRFGIDDTGAIKISWRTASDAAKPQFTDPKAPNYTTAFATNGAALELEYNRNNIRPWVNTLFIRVGRGFLREGDKIVVHLGDRRHGSPGYRLQTAREKPFWFKVFVDAFATYDFVELPDSPTLELVPGPVVRWKAILPTLARAGAAVPARGGRRGPLGQSQREGQCDAAPGRRPAGRGPARDARGDAAATAPPWSKTFACRGRAICGSTFAARTARGLPAPTRCASPPSPRFGHYWGDLHGQSGETVGTGTAAEYYRFARDKAFVDIVGHQGNDFQIDTAFWAEINRIAAELDEPGKFVALPGYEWSGNTGLGGDRNVFFLRAGPADLSLVAGPAWTRTTTRRTTATT